MSEHLRPVPDDNQVALKALSTRRRQLTEMIAMEKTRLAQALDPLVAESYRAVIQALEAACADLIGKGLEKLNRSGFSGGFDL